MVLGKELMIKSIDNIINHGERAKEKYIEALKRNEKRDLRINPLFTKTDECISIFIELKNALLCNNLQDYHIDNAKNKIKEFIEEKIYLKKYYEVIEPWKHDYEFHDEIVDYLDWFEELFNIEDGIENLRNRCNQGGIMVNNIGNVSGDVQIQQNVVNSSQNIGDNQNFDYETANKLVNQIDSMLENIRDEFKDKSEELIDLNNSLRENLNQKNEKGIRDILKKMRKIAESISSGLIANGISEIIKKLL